MGGAGYILMKPVSVEKGFTTDSAWTLCHPHFSGAFAPSETEAVIVMSKSNTIILRVLKSHNGQGTNLPGQFIPGAGAGHGYFQIESTAKGYPTHRILSHVLNTWNQESMLMDYDEQTGAGRMVIVDGYAPEPGTVLELHDDISLCHGASLTLTLGALGIAALESYRVARARFRATAPSNTKDWSLRLEDCGREGAQLASCVLDAADTAIARSDR